MNSLITLNDRSILEISGEDRKKFLQGLITNDINKATEKKLIYSVMLNATGRFLYDFFIFEIGEKLVVDCFAARRDEILQKLNFYKLRSKVEIKKNDELFVTQSFSDQNFSESSFVDPRHTGLGFRNYSKIQPRQSKNLNQNLYHLQRINLKIPESEHDLTYEKSFILEFGFDDLHAIDYKKGCYIGQELTARTHHLGQIRKKIFHVKISNKKTVEKNSEITCQAKPAGLILSSIFFESELHALALIKADETQSFDEFKEKLQLESNKIFIID